MKKPTKKSLWKKTWKVFSQYIRQREADFNGYVYCYTCGAYIHWKEANAGHRYHNRGDFEPLNVRIQCVRCNKWKHGNLGIYERKLIEELGIVGSKNLEKKVNKIIYSYKDLEEIYEKYKKLLAKL